MLTDSRLIDRIYEASVMTDDWPDLLQDIADVAGAKGAVVSMRSPAQMSMIASCRIAADVEGFIAGGWAADTAHTQPLFTEQWPGFRAETDYRTEEEVASLPVHAEYLDPRGYIAASATVIQGSRNDLVHLSFEGFPSHSAARQAIPSLDAIRPHLARAISLTALRGDRSRVVTDSLAMAGVPAAVIGLDSRLRAANAPFVAKMGNRMVELVTGLKFADPFLRSQLAQALERQRYSQGRVQSVAVREDDPTASFAVHLVPLIGAARDACGSSGVLLVIADPANVSSPSSDLLRLLFDLTPAEARVARHLALGGTVKTTAAELLVNDATVRSHLKSIFAKTGIGRQSELVRLLGSLGPPHQ